jgi:hypothetical protein
MKLREVQAIRGGCDVTYEKGERVWAAWGVGESLELVGPVCEVFEKQRAIPSVSQQPKGEAALVRKSALSEVVVVSVVKVVDDIGKIGKGGSAKGGEGRREELTKVGWGPPASRDLGKKSGEDEWERAVFVVTRESCPDADHVAEESERHPVFVGGLVLEDDVEKYRFS